MNEEQAVLDFFAQKENFSLGLTVADQVEKQRVQMNNHYWQALQNCLNTNTCSSGLEWQIEFTEDRNAPGSLVGLHFIARPEQAVYLRPIIEQQYSNGEWRIYFGLMWNVPPGPEHLNVESVNVLKESLQLAGYQYNANFLAWQWTSLYPRRRDFLLRYAREPEILLDKLEAILKELLIDQSTAISQANDALRSAPRSMTISLETLRSKRSVD